MIETSTFIACRVPLLQSAMHGHNNPALDVAGSQAASWAVRLVVAAFMMLSHPFANANRFMVRERGRRGTCAALCNSFSMFF